MYMNLLLEPFFKDLKGSVHTEAGERGEEGTAGTRESLCAWISNLLLSLLRLSPGC